MSASPARRAAGAASAAGLSPPPERPLPWLPAWQTFVKVVEAGSMAGAARLLDCTRAQVSRQVAGLENAFGTRLLERSTRRLALTPAGRVFHQHALAALESVAATQLAVGNLGDEPHGVLRVSATISFGRLHVAPLLPRLAAQYPRLTCELILTDQLVDLEESDIDLALRMTRSPPQDAVARKLASLTRGIYAAPAYLRAHGVPASLADLGRHQTLSYLMTEEHRWYLLTADGDEHVHASTARVRFNNTDCLLDAALGGLGLAILPDYLAAPHAAAGRLRRVLADVEPNTPFGRQLYACYTPSRRRTPKVRALLEMLVAEFEPVPPWERAPAPAG